MQKHKTLAFTGHRPESLPFGENELSASAIRIKTLLADEIMRCAAQGYDTFLAGGARGRKNRSGRFQPGPVQRSFPRTG